MCGISDNQIKARLLQEMDMTLLGNVDICKASENCYGKH